MRESKILVIESNGEKYHFKKTSQWIPKNDISWWIDALESGVYEQGTNFLINPESGGMCCLGLAEFVGAGWFFKQSSNVNNPFPNFDNLIKLGFELDENSLTMGELLVPGIVDVSKRFTVEYDVDLAELNDDFKFTFKQIAEILKFAREPM